MGKKQCRINGHDPSGRRATPRIFVMIRDVLARGIKDISPCCMLYADDIVLCDLAEVRLLKRN